MIFAPAFSASFIRLQISLQLCQTSATRISTVTAATLINPCFMCLPLLKTYKKLQTSMFHSCFNEYAFDDINIHLLTSSCTLHRRKFRTNVSVHICINVSVSACKFFFISLEIYRCACGNIIDRDFQASINLKTYGEKFAS